MFALKCGRVYHESSEIVQHMAWHDYHLCFMHVAALTPRSIQGSQATIHRFNEKTLRPVLLQVVATGLHVIVF